ncbi:hypothetical protein HBN99_03545 [Pseudomonas oryzihabitans]|uniref:hypothetical protein n=1 Tax=Pseudomonas oryzihabitans TaxID=47885 RepID=UPI001474BB9E|nr:hypothetical protein [Pseudomonas oryzihabitans]NMZ63395.1 hypothetical protein [Pseudomonas oryzihabitans]
MQKLNETSFAHEATGKAIISAMVKAIETGHSQYLENRRGKRWLRVDIKSERSERAVDLCVFQFLDRNAQDCGYEITRAAFFHWSEQTMREYERLTAMVASLTEHPLVKASRETQRKQQEAAKEKQRMDALLRGAAHKRQLRLAGATHVVEHKGRRYYARKVTQRVGLFRRKVERWELLGTDFEPYMVFPESIETSEAKLVTMIFWDDSTYQSGDFVRRQA